MANKKKIAVSAVAIAAAASMLLGGTFAWQSISQTALNEKEAVINPGGRLHDDQNWVSAKKNDTNIYVENFTDPEKDGNGIYARVRLEEYMEIVMNYGTDAETVDVVAGSKTLKDGSSDEEKATSQNQFDYTYAVHKFDADNATDDYWTWTEGNKDSEVVYYMPTFNKNKDSLLADLNGVFDATVGGFSSSVGTDKYDFQAVTADSSKTQYAVYDGDTNTADEIGRDTLLDLYENQENAENYDDYKNNIKLVEETHDAAKVGTSNGLISMTEWLALGEGEETGNYWVYDADGWVYWSSPIKAGEATGLLLDSIELKQVMDDTYYYAINVVGQFITEDDLGKDNGTGFYADEDEVPSENALKLLESIGVKVSEDAADDTEDGDDTEVTGKKLTLAEGGDSVIVISSSDSLTLYHADGTKFGAEETFMIEEFADRNTFEDLLVDGTDYTYDSGVLTFKSLDSVQNKAYMMAVSYNDEVEGAIIAVNCSDEVTVSSTCYPMAVGSFGNGVKLNPESGEGSLTLKSVSEYGNGDKLTESDYSYSANTLTLTNDTYKEKVLVVEVENDGETYEVFCYFEAAADDKKDDSSKGTKENPITITANLELTSMYSPSSKASRAGSITSDDANKVTEGTLQFDMERNAWVYNGNAGFVYVRSTNLADEDENPITVVPNEHDSYDNISFRFELNGILDGTYDDAGNDKFVYKSGSDWVVSTYISQDNMGFNRAKFSGEQTFTMCIEYNDGTTYYKSEPIKIIMTGLKSDS